MPHISIDKLKEFGTRIFIGAGVPPEIAERVMINLVRANAYGVHSHGVVRLADYVNAVKSGKVKAAETPTVVKESAVTALLDGHWGFGQVVAERAMQLAIEKARANGIGARGHDRLRARQRHRQTGRTVWRTRAYVEHESDRVLRACAEWPPVVDGLCDERGGRRQNQSRAQQGCEASEGLDS